LSHDILVQLTAIFILGILAQWVAWKIRVPSILLLLGAGIAVGPGFDVIDPNTLFGDVLLPLVSLAVALILYEGGMNLRYRELRKQQIRGVLFRIVTIAVLISWVLGAATAHYIIGFAWPPAVLLGAMLVVTGPTVIGPLLRHLRLRGRVASILKWEGIVVDPLGASLAVLVFSVLKAGGFQAGLAVATYDFGTTLVIGVSLGCAAAAILILVIRNFWVPDSLHNPVSLMLMFGSFTAANSLQHESGLFAVTVMGMSLANQKWVSIRHVLEFKETLTVLLISCLFVVLAARLQWQDFGSVGWESLLFVVVMIVVVRPLSILAATIGTSLSWQERLFLSWMAPRGIVAVAVTSVLSLELVAAGYPRGVELVPVTFLMVLVTVLVYSLSSSPLARRLGLVQVNPQGILFIGAHGWARAMAHALMNAKCNLLLIDTDWDNICFARIAGLPCVYGSALAEKTREEIDYGGLGRVLAVTANNEVNALACVRYLEDFGRKEVYQLAFPSDKHGRYETISKDHLGRLLFRKDLSFARLSEAFGNTPEVRSTKLTKEFDFQAFKALHGDDAIPLFVLKPSGTIEVYTVEDQPHPAVGDSMLWIASGLHTKPPGNLLNPRGELGIA
jgi:NhaP-type Na+/H+ or K+/H+ antiporter